MTFGPLGVDGVLISAISKDLRVTMPSKTWIPKVPKEKNASSRSYTHCDDFRSCFFFNLKLNPTGNGQCKITEIFINCYGIYCLIPRLSFCGLRVIMIKCRRTIYVVERIMNVSSCVFRASQLVTWNHQCRALSSSSVRKMLTVPIPYLRSVYRWTMLVKSKMEHVA